MPLKVSDLVQRELLPLYKVFCQSQSNPTWLGYLILPLISFWRTKLLSYDRTMQRKIHKYVTYLTMKKKPCTMATVPVVQGQELSRASHPTWLGYLMLPLMLPVLPALRLFCFLYYQSDLTINYTDIIRIGQQEIFQTECRDINFIKCPIMVNLW